jgi:hypothetical protein
MIGVPPPPAPIALGAFGNVEFGDHVGSTQRVQGCRQFDPWP